MSQLAKDQALLTIVKDAEGNFESVTVFVSYLAKRQDPDEYKSDFYGPVDIIYSWKSTYLMMDRPNSGFHTGTPLAGEEFIVTDRENALKQAKALYKAR